MWQTAPRLYPLLGLCGGYALVMLFNPVRRALVDGFRCVGRYKRIWIAFALLGFAYFVFQFVTFTPIRNCPVSFWFARSAKGISSSEHVGFMGLPAVRAKGGISSRR